MLTFDPASFSDLSNTPKGRDLWEYLNSSEAIGVLETSTYLHRPALEGLQDKLTARFGDEIRSDRWKQMIGRMTRQVMEARDYQLDQTGVRIRVGDLFTSAARYTKPRPVKE